MASTAAVPATAVDGAGPPLPVTIPAAPPDGNNATATTPAPPATSAGPSVTPPSGAPEESAEDKAKRLEREAVKKRQDTEIAAHRSTYEKSVAKRQDQLHLKLEGKDDTPSTVGALAKKAIHESYLSRKGPTALWLQRNDPPAFRDKAKRGELFNRHPNPTKFLAPTATYYREEFGTEEDKTRPPGAPKALPVADPLSRPPNRTRMTETHHKPWNPVSQVINYEAIREGKGKDGPTEAPVFTPAEYAALDAWQKGGMAGGLPAISYDLARTMRTVEARLHSMNARAAAAAATPVPAPMAEGPPANSSILKTPVK